VQGREKVGFGSFKGPNKVRAKEKGKGRQGTNLFDLGDGVGRHAVNELACQEEDEERSEKGEKQSGDGEGMTNP